MPTSSTAFALPMMNDSIQSARRIYNISFIKEVVDYDFKLVCNEHKQHLK